MLRQSTSLRETSTATTYQRPDTIAGVVIDAHMHIQSGACAPLPVLWTQVPGHFQRKTLERLAWLFVHKASDVQGRSTDKIGELIATESQNAFIGIRKQSPLYSTRPEQDFFAPLIVMPMDMEYAHIAGYPTDGRPSPIYHTGRYQYVEYVDTDMGPVPIERVATVWYFERKHGHDKEEAGQFYDLSHEMPDGTWLYEDFKTQMASTVGAAVKNPFRLIPMFHYDPRRWSQPKGGASSVLVDECGSWDRPFEFIATKETKGVCVGFKVYPPLGYRPLDPRLPTLRDFYALCVKRDIPILTHCSPGGVSAADAELYYQKDNAELTKDPTPASYKHHKPIGYFYDKYVHPKNWAEVLKAFPKLRLCLAHFGGNEWEEAASAHWEPDVPPGWTPSSEYENPPMKVVPDVKPTDWILEMVKLASAKPNVYIDISCFFLRKNEGGIDPPNRLGLQDVLKKVKSGPWGALREKILFGTDWYLTLVTAPKLKSAPTYRQSCEDYFLAFKEIDDELWHQFSYLNPMKFYRFDDTSVVQNMYEALKSEASRRPDGDTILETLERRYEQMKDLRQYTERLKKDMGA